MSIFTLDEARAAILGAVHPLAPEPVPLPEAEGRILGQVVRAPLSLPPFAQSAMDGYAVRAEDTQGGGEIRLRVIGRIAAGQAPRVKLAPGTAVRIMTGAPLPEGGTAVVKQEETRCRGEYVVFHRRLRPGENIIPRGKDVQEGERLLEAGTLITPSVLGLLASLGLTPVTVVRKPRVAILALGDELCEVHEALKPGQIWVSNLYSIVAQIRRYGGIPLNLGISRDRLAEIRAKLATVPAADVYITIGGSQRGDFDLVDDLLLAEKGEIVFRELAVNYSRSLIFGWLKGKPFFGLPGSPIAARVSFELFVRPALWKLAGRTSWLGEQVWAELALPIPASPRRVVAPVRLSYRERQWRALPLDRERPPSAPPLFLANGAIYPLPERDLQAGENLLAERWEDPASP
ncbi:MAG: molybdopterin molybdenumtransferase MoeA [Nitrospinota bacterium]|nr:MAG: molybdopterin molybdenumtransferase MoeA [Nitrospinota bacterium]